MVYFILWLVTVRQTVYSFCIHFLALIHRLLAGSVLQLNSCAVNVHNITMLHVQLAVALQRWSQLSLRGSCVAGARRPLRG